jgi:hypothetical protein
VVESGHVSVSLPGGEFPNLPSRSPDVDVLTATEPERTESTVRAWNFPSRIAFRFCVIYFGLYCIFTQIINSVLAIPNVDVPDWATLGPMRLSVEWVAAHIFGLKMPLVSSGSGSGDKTFDWVLVFCLLVLSGAATAVWSVLDRRRSSYAALDRWFRLFVRFCLAGQMLTYGMVKAVPLQMPFPFLFTQIEPFGNLSPMGILWASVGASPAYEMFAGCAELTAGFLLIFPRTATLGALVCLADLVEIFVLNMTYDVPVKLFSFHLILLCLILLAPEFRRLANFFFLNRAAEPSRAAALFHTRRANRIAFVVGALLWAWMIFCNVYGAWDAFHKYGPGRPKPDLYGIWDVEQVTMDGQSRPPLLTDNVRWRRMIVDFAEFIRVQRMDDTHTSYTASVDPKGHTLALTDSKSKNWKAQFVFQRPSPAQLTLDGSIDGHPVRMELRRQDQTKFLFASRGFHWIQEYPFNR